MTPVELFRDAVHSRDAAALRRVLSDSAEARAAINGARRDREKIDAMRRTTYEQAARARVQAARIRWSWNSRFPNDD